MSSGSSLMAAPPTMLAGRHVSEKPPDVARGVDC
jgi:hypothetical protein